jgi:hypothetical protein
MGVISTLSIKVCIISDEGHLIKEEDHLLKVFKDIDYK